MGDKYIDNLIVKRTNLVNKIKSITDIASDRDDQLLTDSEQDQIKTYRSELEGLDRTIDTASTNLELTESVRERLSAINVGASTAAVSYRSAGELLHDVLHQSDDAARARFTASKRAAEHMGTDAAKTVATAGGFGGLQIATVTGPIIDFHPESRPFVTALGTRAIPEAGMFLRPRIVDANFTTGAAIQAKEKEELASKAFDVKSDQVSMQTVGGYLNVSQQLLRSNASALDIIISQLVKRVSAKTESAVVGQLTANAPDVGPADFTDGTALRGAIYTAGSTVYANTGTLPEWIVMGPAGWAALGTLADLAGRPLFPAIGPVNADGTANVGTFNIGGLGLRGIVSPAITDDTLYIGNGAGIEVYEYRYPVLEAVEPSVLGRQVAVASDIAVYSPTTTEDSTGSAGDAKFEAIVKITSS